MLKSRFLKFNLLLFLFISFSACEKIDVVEVSLPYNEKLVVQGLLEENKPLNGIIFTKTLPLNETYSISKAELKDVVAYIQSGVRVIPLKYDRNGIYRPISSFIPQKESTFELFAKWRDKNVYARTYIPANPKIVNAYFLTDGSGTYIQAEIQNQVGVVFGAKAVAMEGGNILYESEDFYSVTSPDGDPKSIIKVRTPSIPGEALLSFKNSFSIKVFAFDEQYQDYFKTKRFSFPIKDSFVQSGGDVDWNVRGDGIGLFIGYSSTTLKVNR